MPHSLPKWHIYFVTFHIFMPHVMERSFINFGSTDTFEVSFQTTDLVQHLFGSPGASEHHLRPSLLATLWNFPSAVKNWNYKTWCWVKKQLIFSFDSTFKCVSLTGSRARGRRAIMVSMVAFERGAIVLAPSGFNRQNRLSFGGDRPPNEVHGKSTI